MRQGTGSGLPGRPSSSTVTSTVASPSTSATGRSSRVISPMRTSSGVRPTCSMTSLFSPERRAAGRYGQVDDHVVLVGRQAAQFLVVEQHLPRLLHVLLAQAERRFAGVALGLKAHDQARPFRLRGEVAPLAHVAGAQVMQSGVEDERPGLCRSGADERRQGEQGQVTRNHCPSPALPWTCSQSPSN